MFALTDHAQSQEKRDTILLFSGRLINEQTGKPVKFAHVINQTWSHVVISDTLGFFKIHVRLNDLLMVTSIGFYDFPIYIYDTIARENKLHIYRIIPKIYSLPGVSVLRLGTYEQFKYNFLSLKLPGPEHPADTSVFKKIDKGIDTVGNAAPLTITGPVSALYNLLSKEGKSLRKYKKLKEEEEFWKKVEYKYNVEMLVRITHLQGPELYEFINFCNFSKEFIKESSEYEIIENVLEKLKEYKVRESGVQKSGNN
jgi:hypothetical protein